MFLWADEGVPKSNSRDCYGVPYSDKPYCQILADPEEDQLYSVPFSPKFQGCPGTPWMVTVGPTRTVDTPNIYFSFYKSILRVVNCVRSKDEY